MNKNIYIADSYLHYDLQKELLSKADATALAGVQVLDFHSFLTQYAVSKENPIIAYGDIYTRFQAIQDNLFNELLDNASFVKEIYQIHKELQRNDTLPQDIPSNKQSQASLLELLQAIQDIPTNGLFLAEAYQRISTIQDFSFVTFVNFTYTCTWEKKIYDYLCNHGAKSIHTKIPTESVQYYFSLNKRLECECIAQEILRLVNQGTSLSEIGIMVSDINAYKDVLTFVMNRYNIPIYIPLDQRVSIQDFLRAFFSYYTKPNLDTLSTLLSNSFLNISHCEQLFAYASALHLEYEDWFVEFDYFNKIKDSPFLGNGNDTILQSYEEKAKIAQVQYLSFLQNIDCASFHSLLSTLYDFLKTQVEDLKEQDITFINRFFEEFYPFSESFPNLPLSFCCQLATSYLENAIEKNDRCTNQILVCDLQSPPLSLNYGFLLGMHQKAYPAFQSYSGLLNEELIAELPNFLSLSTRYDSYMQSVASNLHFAKHILIFYPQSNYEGKTNEPSLELEMEFHVKKPTLFKIQENNQSYQRSYELDQELAQKLFFTNHTIKGSYTSFEKYFSCPYAYFLKSGLRLKNLFSFKIKEAEIGTLQHAFLEKIVEAKGKQYVFVSDEEIDEFLAEEFLHYETVFRHDQTTIDNLKKQIKTNLKNVLDNLSFIEAHTQFQPSKQEYHFIHNLLTYKEITLSLSGFIDRIDEIAQGVRIIDYKSSHKSFQKKKFHSGESLQLITYAYIASELLKKEVFGIYYFSMNSPSTKQIASYVKRPRYSKKLEQYEVQTPSEADVLHERKRNALTGQTFVTQSSDLLLLDDTAGECVSDIKPGNKAQLSEGIMAKVSSPFLFEDAKQQLLFIYRYLIDSLLEGNIECSPTEKACTYCEYSAICMYKGIAKARKPIIQEEESEVSEDGVHE